MLSVLNDEEYIALAAVAETFNMAILTEISTDEERDRAIKLNAKMIGINNRNLRDLSTDIARTFDYAPTLPDDCIVISESGIYTNDQVRELAPAVDGFLVGSSVMAEDDIDLACRKLIYGPHKVCGLTQPEDAQTVADVGSTLGGLIFAEKSPRCVTQSQALNIVTSSPSLNYVGVFVNHDIDNIVALATSLSLYAVQLHGSEDQTYINVLRQKLKETKAANCLIIKAIAVENNVPLLAPSADLYLLDGKSPGSGQVFNWQALADSEQSLSSCYLAGGLSPENIEAAVTQLTAQELVGFDLNSGVETSPGKKSREKLQQVFAKIRNY